MCYRTKKFAIFLCCCYGFCCFFERIDKIISKRRIFSHTESSLSICTANITKIRSPTFQMIVPPSTRHESVKAKCRCFWIVPVYLNMYWTHSLYHDGMKINVHFCFSNGSASIHSNQYCQDSGKFVPRKPFYQPFLIMRTQRMKTKPSRQRWAL